MKPSEFAKAFYPHAKKVEEKIGVPALAILAQAAVESGWGKVAPGNMFFGVKDTDGINGNEQLITTTEYLKTATAKFPEVISVTPVIRNGQKYFKYKVKDYFRKYNSPEECFADHAKFFVVNKRYAKALAVKSDYKAFIKAIAAAGYATDPNYANVLISVADSIKKFI